MRADTAGNDFRLRIIFGANRGASQATQHRQLAYVREGIRDRALEEFLRPAGELGIRGEVIIQSF